MLVAGYSKTTATGGLLVYIYCNASPIRNHSQGGALTDLSVGLSLHESPPLHHGGQKNQSCIRQSISLRSLAQRKPMLVVELSGVLEVRAATR